MGALTDASPTAPAPAGAARFPSVLDAFEAQARRTPDAIAAVGGSLRWTYRELDAHADAVAAALGSIAAGPEMLVAVCLTRTPMLVAALLGTWKAGGAYVPLDPAYPRDRLAWMLGDARPVAIITEPAAAANLPADAGPRLDVHATVARAPAPSPRTHAPDPRALAYVMYTSGSTGRPKGAMIEHGALANYVAWAATAYDLRAGDSVPVHSSIAFDLTVTALYPPLTVGGWVELLPDGAGASELATALRREGGRGLVKITPAHLDLLHAHLGDHGLAGRARVFVIGGENLHAESLDAWRRFAPDSRLVNEYGPTETVVGCCTHEVTPADAHTGTVPIGRAIAGTTLHVLDSDLHPVADGDVGELFIGGAGVARGYLGRDALTAERFVPDPWGPRGARLYRSGDLVRRRSDGLLECLGRVDDQVKVHGYRVELGEVEAAIASHPSVAMCATAAHEDATGTRELVAYVTTRPGASLDGADVREHLRAILPEFMVPAHCLVVDALPLTANGKVDRSALPSPREWRAAARSAQAADGSTAAVVAAIWAELLGQRTVAPDDDVFDLGAHSLMTVQALSRIRERFGVDLQLRSIFERPTPAGMAAVVDALRWAARASGAGASDGRREDREEFVL